MGAAGGKKKFDAEKLVTTYHGALNDKYTCGAQLGQGAQGFTYLVTDKSTGFELVAKETHDLSEEGIQSFVEEFEKVRQLSVGHPNIAKVHELIQGHDKQGKVSIYVISELARGSDLFKYMKKAVEADVFNEDLISQIFKQAMNGVAYMHGHGVVHNDLKPDNILMIKEFRPDQAQHLEQGMVVINDFGCATLSRDRLFICGDPRYQSPETWVSMDEYMDETSTKVIKKMQPSADVWSMGVTLYELLSGGVLPFVYTEIDLQAIMNDADVVQRLRESITSPTPLDLQRTSGMTSISEGCQELVSHMLRKSKGERPTAQNCLSYKWFAQSTTLRRRASLFSKERFEFKADKSQARQILLNALASKLQREHMDKSFIIFDKYDSDHSGEIDREEFKLALAECGQDAGTADMLFERGDVDEDGTLSFTEFVAATFDWTTIEPGELDKQLQGLISHLDGDNDSTIDITELAELFEGALSNEEVKDVFSKIDADGNGKIDSKEMHTFLFNPSCCDTSIQKHRKRRSSVSVPAFSSSGKTKEDAPHEVVITAGAVGALCWAGIWKMGHPLYGGLACAATCAAGMLQSKRR